MDRETKQWVENQKTKSKVVPINGKDNDQAQIQQQGSDFIPLGAIKASGTPEELRDTLNQALANAYTSPEIYMERYKLMLAFAIDCTKMNEGNVEKGVKTAQELADSLLAYNPKIASLSHQLEKTKNLIEQQAKE